MIRINTQDDLSLYNLEGKWNDFIAVQKEVIAVLKEEKYFNDNIINNIESGLFIKINPKGIKETIGAGMRFQRLPRKLKEYWFWIHHIDEKEKSPKLLDPSKRMELKEI